MNNVTLTSRIAEEGREIENLWSTDHALHVYPHGSTMLGESQVAEYSPLIELDSSSGLSTVYRDTVTTTNSGSVSNSNGEHNLSTGTTANSTAQLKTTERGRYMPGIVGLPGIAIRRPTAMTSDQEITWGYYDDTDGIFFGEDSTGIFVRHRHNSTDEDKVYQSNWNVDPLDGTGPSGLTLDLKKVTIFRYPFLWYGGGPAEMIAEVQDSSNKNHNVVVHRFGALEGEPFFSNPKLPIRADVDNGTTTTDVDLFVVGRQFGVLGRYNPNRRVTAEERLGVNTSTTTIPLVSFRKKNNRQDEAISVKVNGVAISTDTNSLWEIIIGGSLTNESFGSVTRVADSETSLEVDTSATAISGGTAIDKGLAVGGQGSSSSLAGIRGLGLDIPDDTVVTLAIRTVSGTGSASTAFALEEEW